jgi:hAT family C-terminal dimerisation region/Hermes transposase DNA-binding domain
VRTVDSQLTPIFGHHLHPRHPNEKPSQSSERLNMASAQDNQATIERELRASKPDHAYKIVDNIKGTAAIWRKFGIVENAAGMQLDFAACRGCKATYVYKTGAKATGTTTINKHVCRSLTSSVGVASMFFKKHTVTEKDKAQMTRTAANFCASDMRPIEAVAGIGLKDLIQTALNIGVASSGHIDVNDLLAHPVTVRRNLELRASQGRAFLTNILKKHFESGVGVACTFDLWTDEVKKTSFMSITMHYIDENFTLHARTLHVKPVREASHTGAMVLQEFQDGLAVFGILEDDYGQIHVISDSGSNCCSADFPSMFIWFPCLDHKLATVLTTVVNKTTTQKNGIKSGPHNWHANHPHMADIFNLIDSVKKLVEWFKRSNMQCKLEKTLKQENATRWNSLLCSLVSVYDMYDDVYEILEEKNKLGKLLNIPKTLLKELIDFLDLFQQVTCSLEQCKQPALHKAVYWRYSLLHHLLPVMANVVNEDATVMVPKDSLKISAIKTIMLPILKDKFEVQALHIMASLLDPIMKNRLGGFGVGQDDILECKAMLKGRMVKYGQSLNLDGNELSDTDDSCLPMPRKKMRQSLSMYDDTIPDDDDVAVEEPVPLVSNFANRIDIEYRTYITYKVSDKEFQEIASMNDGDFQVLPWWKHKGAMQFPILALVVRSILCIPVSSAKSENNFLDAGNTITKKRNRLKAHILNDLMFMGSNQDICK